MATRGRPKAELVLSERGARDPRALGAPADERPGAGAALPHRARLRRGADQPGGGRRPRA